MTQELQHYKLEDGSERWELDDQLHREDGPALITPEGEFWYRHGKEMPPEEAAARQNVIAEEKKAIEMAALRREGETVADVVKSGTARPVVAMRPLRFHP
jgi:hypothetical protein